MITSRLVALVGVLGLAMAAGAGQGQGSEPQRAAELRGLDAAVLVQDEEGASTWSRMLADDVRARIRAANQRENRAWRAVQGREDWEPFRDQRLKALRASLGPFPAAPQELNVRVSRTVQGEGFRIENLVFQSRPGLLVTANLYLPDPAPRSMPGVLISHSHHAPKTQGELQDMGMTWARQGCAVLVPDHLGHGERRQHPFRTSQDYPGPFRAGRQDYYFRYNTAVQLQVAGESLMGWMVWDLMRAADVLLARPGVDPQRLILLGAVAGGGDPAAVTAALDDRIQAVVPFNFGGPQPDYAIADNADRDFYYFGVAYWESTRCLRRGARDGFAHWLIASAVAPRRLVYAHEFAWDQPRDPVWPRIRQVFAWYDAADHLATAAGQGTLRGSPPESSHCANIGALHRSRIYPAFQRWFAMPIAEEYRQRRDAEELHGLTRQVLAETPPRPVYQLASELGAERAGAARRHREGLPPGQRHEKLRADWQRLLGDVQPPQKTHVRSHRRQQTGQLTVERVVLEPQPDIVLPLLLLIPPHDPGGRLPVVVMLAQQGKQALLQQRSETIAELLDAGLAVCLPDVRGTGETRAANESRRWRGSATTVSATEWLLGQTLLGSRLRDVRTVLRYLRTRPDVDPGRLALWGDSLARPNRPEALLAVPLDAGDLPDQAEPLGGLLALLGGLFEPQVWAVYSRGGLAGYHSLLQSPFCYVPHDVLVPDALTAGDLADVAAAIAPRPLRIENALDGQNRIVAQPQLATTFQPARRAYRSLQAERRLHLHVTDDQQPSPQWLLEELRLIGPAKK